MPDWTTAYSIVYILIEVLAIVSALHALWYVRTTQATIAWVVGLVAMPVVALPLYLVFGRYRFYGYRESIREVGRRHRRAVAVIEWELSTKPNARTTTLTTPLEKLADVLDTPICENNEAGLLIDGQQFFDEALRQIDSAKRYVYVQFYIIRDDEIGNRIADALIEAASRGVTVRFLYDEIGSLQISSRYLERFLNSTMGVAATSAGVRPHSETQGEFRHASGTIDIRPFYSRRGPANRFQLNFRNHRKLIVVDGRTALVGGLNLGDEYLGRVAWTSHWHDAGVILRGPIVRKVQAVFASDYFWAARETLPEAEWTASPSSSADHTMRRLPSERRRAALCVTGPIDERPQANLMFMSVAASSERRLWIATPYLVPDETSIAALTMARARGVDVRLLLPSVPDSWPVFLAGYYYEKELLMLGIRVFRYQPGVMHHKCVLCDDSLALIGSANLDNRSLHLNFELMVAIEDAGFIQSMAQMFENDWKKSNESTLSAKSIHPWRYRSGRIIARLFSPVL